MSAKTSPHHKPSKLLVESKNGNTLSVKPCSLDIIWGGDDRYWRIPKDETDPGPVELLQVSWLQVTGSLDANQLRLKGKELKFKFNVRLKSDAFGWKGAPVYLTAGVRGARSWKMCDLSLLRKETVVEVPQYPRVRVPADAASNEQIHFGMYEIWTGTWKGGLVIHDVVIEVVN